MPGGAGLLLPSTDTMVTWADTPIPTQNLQGASTADAGRLMLPRAVSAVHRANRFWVGVWGVLQLQAEGGEGGIERDGVGKCYSSVEAGRARERIGVGYSSGWGREVAERERMGIGAHYSSREQGGQREREKDVTL